MPYDREGHHHQANTHNTRTVSSQQHQGTQSIFLSLYLSVALWLYLGICTCICMYIYICCSSVSFSLRCIFLYLSVIASIISLWRTRPTTQRSSYQPQLTSLSGLSSNLPILALTTYFPQGRGLGVSSAEVFLSSLSVTWSADRR